MATHFCTGNPCTICNPPKELGTFDNPVQATFTLQSGYVGSFYSSSFYVSTVKPKRVYGKIIGKQFKQHTSFKKKCGPNKKFKRTIFYGDVVTITRRSSMVASNLFTGKQVRSPRVYLVSMNGMAQLAGGVTYRQLKKYFTPC